MTSARLLSIMQAERAEWEDLLAQVGEAQMTEPGVEGPWSVKDIVAHLTWYDRTFVEGAQALRRGEPFVRTGLRALAVDVTHHDITYCVTYRVRGQRVIVLRVRDTRQAGAWMSAQGYFDRAAAAWDETVGDAGVVAIAVRAEPDC